MPFLQQVSQRRKVFFFSFVQSFPFLSSTLGRGRGKMCVHSFADSSADSSVSPYRCCIPSGYRRPPILSPFFSGTVGTSPGQTDSLEASPLLLHVGTIIRTVPLGGAQPYRQFSKRVHPSCHPQDSSTGKIWKILQHWNCFI